MTRALAFALAALLAAGPACGGDGDEPRLTVSAASSLKRAFDSYAESVDYARVRYSFAGSDELAAQIRQGAKPDVYAAGNAKLPRELAREGLLEQPVEFASNRLVLAAPADSSRVRSLRDLERPGVKLVTGSPSVPIGSYTRDLLARLGERRQSRIAANVRSREPDVAGIVGKLAQGGADAGFVYATDVIAGGGKLREVELPRRLRPRVAYALAVVKGARRSAEARRFVNGLLGQAGRSALRAAGFVLPAS